jgi:hypothetical protein
MRVGWMNLGEDARGVPQRGVAVDLQQPGVTRAVNHDVYSE